MTTRRLAVFLTAVLLLAPILSVHPACEEHGSEAGHDDHDCPICLLLASASGDKATAGHLSTYCRRCITYLKQVKQRNPATEKPFRSSHPARAPPVSLC